MTIATSERSGQNARIRERLEAEAPGQARDFISDDHQFAIRRWREIAAKETSPAARRVMDAYVTALESIDTSRLGEAE
ncbi:hypothetical protein [Streptomyces noursei]|uniref:hypothetical protein n=1 Tax=Streptomyces noursei TaxID=1971 RepID=UPI001678D78E|nr:hypothetical protein [Streptomyces noursei]MCZ1021197.1 hypothetical protein [Streptomyces noursei]GGX57361.1 hypothetical protein GCM10010341_91750 [Streptomyces noursei]